MKDKTTQRNKHCRENSHNSSNLAQKGNAQAEGNVPGKYRTACNSSSQMGEFISETMKFIQEAGALN